MENVQASFGGEEDDVDTKQVYVLSASPSEVCYKEQDDTIAFKFENKYGETGDVLDYEVTLVGELTPENLSTINIEEGNNIIELDVSTLSTGYYQLKVFGKQEETFYLKFEVD